MASYNNYTTTTLANGVVLTAPIIANASYCVLQFAGTTTNAGEVRHIKVGTNSITLTLDANGKGVVSLMPFMRADMETRSVLDHPMGNTNNKWRGVLDLVVSEPNSESGEERLLIYYIFGDCPPRDDMVSEVWRTYNTATGDYNVLELDWADHYSSAGVPNSLDSFRSNLNDPALWVTPPSEANNTVNVAAQEVDSNIITRVNSGNNKIYHFDIDCRADGVVQLRWIDSGGNENTRKFTKGVETQSGAAGDSYTRPHDYRVINSHYYAGRDEWANITPTRTLNVGDDAIPIEQFDWLRGLVTSQAVEMLEDNVWVRCNLGDASVERDPKKGVFAFSIQLILPTPENVEL